MNYLEWEQSVPEEIRGDTLWRMRSYRLSLFVAELGWRDCSKLHSDQRTKSLSDQLYRALGSIGANIAEGYSRKSGKDQARFYEYALGSVRESKDWYYKSRHKLNPNVVDHRLIILTEIKKLLLATVTRQRSRGIRESKETYVVDLSTDVPQPSDDLRYLDKILTDVPI